MFRNNRIVLYICPTMNCNFSCSYCFEAGNKRKINMTEDVEDAIIRFLVKNKEKKDFYNLVWRRAIIEYKDYRKYYQKIRNGAC